MWEQAASPYPVRWGWGDKPLQPGQETTITGAIYATTGTPFGLPYNVAQFVGNTVGNVTFSFSDASHATFSYTVDGITTQSKAVVRQPF